MDNLIPTTKQKVWAILTKKHKPAKKCRDRISWHWSEGFRVSHYELLEVRYEKGLGNVSNPDKEIQHLTEYQKTLGQAGVKSLLQNGRLLVAGITETEPGETPPKGQLSLFNP